MHDLRHGVATELLRAGVPIHAVSAQLGHRAGAQSAVSAATLGTVGADPTPGQSPLILETANKRGG